MDKDAIFRLCLGLFVQVWSWGMWAQAQVCLWEGKEYGRCRADFFPSWFPKGGFFEGLVAGIMAGLMSIHANLLVSHPRNLYQMIGLPYLGVCINISVFLLVLREVCRGGPYRFSGPPSLWPLFRYTKRASIVNRVCVAVMAYIMSFGIWLTPWCCVR